jgi:mono/diheme cytochrome c family protein
MATGGEMASGGSSETGGVPATGGKTGNGGNETGGRVATGGAISTGGSTSKNGGASGQKDAGTPDTQSNTPDTSPGKSDASSAPVSYKTQIQPLMTANCVSCHGPKIQSSGIRVDTYANLSSNLVDVTDVLVNGAMPMSGALPDADRQMFQDWVDQGAKNN